MALSAERREKERAGVAHKQEGFQNGAQHPAKRLMSVRGMWSIFKTGLSGMGCQVPTNPPTNPYVHPAGCHSFTHTCPGAPGGRFTFLVFLQEDRHTLISSSIFFLSLQKSFKSFSFDLKNIWQQRGKTASPLVTRSCTRKLGELLQLTPLPPGSSRPDTTITTTAATTPPPSLSTKSSRYPPRGQKCATGSSRCCPVRTFSSGNRRHIHCGHCSDGTSRQRC